LLDHQTFKLVRIHAAGLVASGKVAERPVAPSRIHSMRSEREKFEHFVHDECRPEEGLEESEHAHPE
jgi:hypothetical protein